MILFRGKAEVLSIEERFETLRGYKGADGQTVIDKNSLGWFVRITNSSAIRVGNTKPDIQPGDQVVLTLEKP